MCPNRTYAVELTPPDIEPYRAGNTGIDYVTTFDSGDRRAACAGHAR